VLMSAVVMLIFLFLMLFKRRTGDKEGKKKVQTDDALDAEVTDFTIDEDSRPRRKKVRGVRRVVLILSDIFFALCLLALALAIGLTAMAKKSGQAVEVAGFRPFMIATGSMEPVFQVDGLVITHADNFDKVQVGDVVAFKAEGLKGQPALHRVVAISGEGQSKQFIVKGDNNPHPDGAPVTRDNYIGRIFFKRAFYDISANLAPHVTV